AALAARGIRAKLTVSQPDDPDERDADRIAERVAMGRSAAPVDGGARMPSFTRETSGRVDRAVAAVRHHGQPLTRQIMAELSPHFGRDLSHVRVHTHDAA